MEELERSRYAVLVVEDDSAVRCLLEREIADRGHPVTAVDSAKKALEVLGQNSYAVVITDIRMPGMDGVELTRQIKDLRPQIEVILITGYASVDSASSAVRLGAADYLTKPFGDIDRISQSLDRALEQHCRRLATQHRIVRLEAHRETLAHLMDRLPMGVILLGGDGTVLMTNRAAEQILGEADGLGVKAGRLQGGNELRGLLSQATRITEGTRVGRAITLERPSERPALSTLVTPLGDVAASIGNGEPAAAIFVSDPGHRVENAEELLCRLYTLTPTEARMTAVLMQGRSVEDAAGELAISTNTARTHLKRVFSKTGTSRQGELISLLLSGPALLRLEQDR